MLNSGRPNCSGRDLVKPRSEAPNPHPDVKLQVKIKADERNETVPVLILTLTQPSDGEELKVIATSGTLYDVQKRCINC